MVQKILNLTAFKNSVEYVVNKDRANFLDTNLLSQDPDKIVKSFLNGLRVKEGGKQITNIGKHFILSYHPREHISPAQKLDMAKIYLKEQGYENSDYIVVEHNDTSHEHMHIICSRIDRTTNKAVKDNNERFNGRRICFELENNYNLIRTSPFAKTKENMFLRQEYTARGDNYHKGDLIEFIEKFDFELNLEPSKFVNQLKEKGFKTYVTKDEKKILFEKEGFVFTQKNLGKKINSKLKIFKDRVSDNDKSIRYLKDNKDLKMFINEKTKLFVNYEILQKKYNEATVTYELKHLSINNFKNYSKSDIDFRTSSVDEQNVHVEELKRYNLDEFRFNPQQLSDIILAKTEEEKAEVIKEALEFNFYRSGELTKYYIQDLFNIEKHNTLVKVNDEQKVQNYLLNKITNSASETERGMYLLSTRIICRYIKNGNITFDNNMENKNANNDIISLIDNKYKEILDSRESFAERIENYKIAKEQYVERELDKLTNKNKKHSQVQSIGGRNEIDDNIDNDRV